MHTTHHDLIATASLTIRAPRATVWEALVTPAAIKQYMFGASVTTDWLVGDPITWKGEFNGKEYEDRGTILRFKPYELLQYTHFSPRNGTPDTLENHHIVTLALSTEGPFTRVVLTQDNNASDEAMQESQANWETILAGLKKFVEK